jgi:hypothetical protein
VPCEVFRHQAAVGDAREIHAVAARSLRRESPHEHLQECDIIDTLAALQPRRIA